MDLLRVTPAVLGRLGVPVPTQSDLVGFSQGGHTTMASARVITAGASIPFGIRSIIGISGPYVLSEVDVPALMDGRSDPNVRSLALARLTLSAELRGNDLAHMYAPGRRDRVHRLFDGSKTDVEVVRALPPDPRTIFSDWGWRELGDGTSDFGRWLADTSGVCQEWGRDADVTLMYGRLDTSALPRNTRLCAEHLNVEGARLQVISLGDVDHIESGVIGTDRAARILADRDRLRR
ncbi:hypothetical protein GS4_05_01310 [Gordonia soli NBRC 108243]|uniref:Uncharacterized protein n=1 Tax=Gordonia soli NBRC 108243 TaxID=1223545 RepID=M0QHP1_9ACTN|nr:hypothetical protein GS4_05_01310 [Gordonia soli NBRC 108243]